ncbi:hypothetical protein DVH26_03940 [Paenibacillus sp. H1-7]|nr:hypothetical protein DVH26_03940 [Paenibacillus sp. H1-7]
MPEGRKSRGVVTSDGSCRKGGRVEASWQAMDLAGRRERHASCYAMERTGRVEESRRGIKRWIVWKCGRGEVHGLAAMDHAGSEQGLKRDA